MKIKIITFVLILLYSLLTPVFAADTFSIEGLVKDRATDTDLFGVHVRLLNAVDSTLYAETEAKAYVKNQDVPLFIFRDLDRTRNYILELTRAGYELVYMDIDPSTLSKRLNVMNLGSLYMKKEPKMLDEVVVKASKVMFYNKGDTVIYNADAFVLAEGSMLDALIRQMPGVELKEGGEIYVNGRYVESLLLNGKDFFNGNRQTMLENLGAYTVKDIAVYECQDEMDKIMGKDYGDKHLSMDVRLKKEYNQGLLANTEAGYGSSDRYLGRLFGLWYCDNARLSVYGNANNLSDKRKPGQDTGFTPGSMRSGDFKTYQGGFDYWAKVPYKNVSFSGEVMATHQTLDDDRTVLTTNFLPGGDTYGYSYAQSKSKSLSLTTSHSLEIQRPRWNFKVSPSLKYFKNNDLSSLSAATFSREWKDAGKDFVDSLYNKAPGELLATTLNRNKDDNKRLGHSLDAGLTANGKIKMPNDVDAVTYLVSGNYKGHHFDRFQRYTLNFGSDPTPTDHYDRYFDDTPNYRWSGIGEIGYIWAVRPGMFLTSAYRYNRVYNREVSDLYRLEDIYDSMAEGRLLGWLPSKAEYESTLDPNNSYNSTRIENNHSINFYLTWEINKLTDFRVRLPLIYRNQHLHYIRGDVNASLSRNRIFVGDTRIEFNYWGDRHIVNFEYNRKVTSPNLVDMVDFKNDLDPLNIQMGNSGLKDSETHQLFLMYRNSKNPVYQYYTVDAMVLSNALAYGYSYNSATGVKNGRMYNVNGNYKIGISQDLSVYFGNSGQFNIGNTTKLNYRRSVDLISENTLELEKNKVNNPSLSEGLNFSFKFGKSKISLNGELGLSRFMSKQSNFRNFTAKDLKYGANGNFTLPAGFGLSTDFTVYTRRGYSDSTLNKTNFVWNARASYTILKGQLTFMVDGFDILHNLTNVFYSVNAQARTETYTNVLPRYVMMHVQWKFHKAPKKK